MNNVLCAFLVCMIIIIYYCFLKYIAEMLIYDSIVIIAGLMFLKEADAIVYGKPYFSGCIITQYGSTVYIGMALVWPAL